MKKNILIKTLSSVAALASVGGLTTLTTLTSCSNNKPAITINNKKTEWDWIGGTYQLDVTFKNQDDAKLLFSSSDESVATVDENGLITATGNGITLITAYSSEDSGVYDKFKLNINELWVKGVVYDSNKKPISNVKICYDEATTLTNSDGSYYIRLKKPGSVLYFEKPGYIGEAISSTYSLASQEHILDVTLTPYWVGTPIQVSGKVLDAKGQPVKNRSVTFYPNSEYERYKRHFVTDENGEYKGEINVPSAENLVNVPVVVHGSDIADYDSTIAIDPKEHEQELTDITVPPFQYDVKAYVGNSDANEKIIMHPYYTTRKIGEVDTKGLLVTFESNFVRAFNDKNNFKLTITKSTNISQPNKQVHEDGTEFDVTFGCLEGKAQVIEHTGNVNVDWNNVTVNKKDSLNLEIFIPGTATNSFFEDEPTLGVHLYSFGRGTFTPYEHAKFGTEASNELSYIRVDKYNAVYPASDNKNPFDLTWDTKTDKVNWTVTDTLGNVASKYNFGYQIKIARYKGSVTERQGLYIMTKYAQPQMAHFLPDAWQPHFFFDPSQEGYAEPGTITREADDVKHIAPISGYWMQQFEIMDLPDGRVDPFANRQEYNQIFVGTSISDSPKVYGENDLMITYIPYDFIGIDPTDDDEFGFTCNLQYHYTGGEWFAWEGENPTGYSDVPHFEDLASYIRFKLSDETNDDLSIIPYSV